MESVASYHNTIAEQLESSLRKTVKYRAKDNEKLKKQVFLYFEVEDCRDLMKFENQFKN